MAIEQKQYLENRSIVDNRYALTDIHIDDSVAPGRRRYGLWRTPALTNQPELSLKEGEYDRFTVTSANLGRIDMIAWIHYRDVSMWWAIAYYNSIRNPLTDLEVGTVLLIPKRSFIVNAIEQGDIFR